MWLLCLSLSQSAFPSMDWIYPISWAGPTILMMYLDKHRVSGAISQCLVFLESELALVVCMKSISLGRHQNIAIVQVKHFVLTFDQMAVSILSLNFFGIICQHLDCIYSVPSSTTYQGRVVRWNNQDWIVWITLCSSSFTLILFYLFWGFGLDNFQNML